jgi:hypothetical protein
MSAHFSKFGLNTYYGSPYFQAHIPEDYPLSLVLQKSRAFRRLPPHLRELSAQAKKWAQRTYPGADVGGIDRWYDTDGYELDPDTGRRMTDEEIDAEWVRWPEPEIVVKDIPLPPGGFADPDTWEEQPPKPPEPDPDDVPTEAQILRDIATRSGGPRGWKDVAEEYGVPLDWLARVTSDKDLVRMILGMYGKPWPAAV